MHISGKFLYEMSPLAIDTPLLAVVLFIFMNQSFSAAPNRKKPHSQEGDCGAMGFASSC